MATTADMFLDNLGVIENSAKNSDYCVVKTMGKLQGQLGAAAEKVENGYACTPADNEFLSALLWHFESVVGEIIDDTTREANSLMEEVREAENHKDHLRDVESSLDSLADTIDNLTESTIGELTTDIESAAEEVREIWRNISV